MNEKISITDERLGGEDVLHDEGNLNLAITNGLLKKYKI